MAIGSLRLPFLFSCFFSLFIVVSSARPGLPSSSRPGDNPFYDCSDIGNYTTNSTYQTNLRTLLSILPSQPNQENFRFCNLSFGQVPDKVNVIAFCRGDIAADTCRSCVRSSAHNISEICPQKKEAFAYLDDCQLRYSNRTIFGVVENEPNVCYTNPEFVSSSDGIQFKSEVERLLKRLRIRAASVDSKFATGKAIVNSQTIYALTQCSPGLSMQQCDDCLVTAIGEIQNCCLGNVGGSVVRPSCNFRFDPYMFYTPTADTLPPESSPQPVSPPPREGKDDKKSANFTIIIVISVVITTTLIISCSIFLRARKQRGKPNIVDEIRLAESLQFDLGIIRIATDDFSDVNKLGQGGFGVVYKGRLFSGQDIAVKRLSRDSGQGNSEFENEILLVAKLQHRNLVRLLGFCLEGNERLLIYEFVPNGSLDHFIFDPIKRTQFNWETRYEIIRGIARGILYLHEDSQLRIIHRDLKASNILLDEEMNPKISDFGMARLFAMDQTQGETSTIVGTYGYMAPEYAMHGHFSIKSDVFSFGVLVLEITSGRKNVCFRNGKQVENLMSFAWRNWEEGTIANLIDPYLKDGSASKIQRLIHIGLLCIQKDITQRPTMASVIIMLNSSSCHLQMPSPPAYLAPTTTDSNMAMKINWMVNTSSGQCGSLQTSINDISISELYPR
ncbi:cysteine-rich receptor-like protein kinase 44 [Hevea brasiliensis]|uniref:cysteine-rich receptor-like protein kinase 44 n=1 Tax=Hevea brasiliensis TaxID=3981 RepID=UPI0025DB03B2|nr:cysteine-rich receptor-like protein kinase 44 [Hevea brasiliensis]